MVEFRGLGFKVWGLVKGKTGGEFRVYRAFYKASIRYVDLL